jgi:hypothetical protein
MNIKLITRVVFFTFLLSAKSWALQPPTQYKMTDEIRHFNEKYSTEKVLASLEKIVSPFDKFLAASAFLVEIQAIDRKFNARANSPYTFIGKGGRIYMQGTTASSLTEAKERARFVQEKKFNAENIKCVQEIGDLQKKLRAVLVKIMDESDGNTAASYKKLYEALYRNW